MKILKIRLKNLNSLRGVWEVDLEHPAFTGDGIFAVTGPTGAGKTTLFDAVCLALYGRTPRQRSLSAQVNEVMSRHAADCMAEVTFRTQEGTFVCHWTQRRTGGKGAKKFQSAQHELSRADGGEIVSASLRDTAAQVQRLTGLDFDRFTRTILLAQGGFDAFLRAGRTERAAILEMLTGTEIYSHISQYVFARDKQESESLRDIKVRIEALNLLSSEAEAAARQELEQGAAEEKKLETEHKETSGALEWLERVRAVRDKLKELEGQREALNRRIEAFAPERERLEAGRRAAALEGDYGQLLQVRTEQAADQRALDAEEASLPGLGEAAERSQAAHAVAVEALKRARDEAERAEPLLREVRLRDQELSTRERDIGTAQENHDKDAASLRSREKAREKLRKDQERTRKEWERAREELKGLEGVSSLSGVEERARTWRERVRDVGEGQERAAGAQEELVRARDTLAAAQEVREALSRELDGVEKALSRDREDLERLLDGRLLREYRAELEARQREWGLQQRIASLEAERERLQEGCPCPLCGSLEHPWASGGVPERDETEKAMDGLRRLIDEAEARQEGIEELKAGRDAARTKLHEAERSLTGAAEREKAAAKALELCRSDLSRLEEAAGQSRLAFLEALTPFNIFSAEDPETPLRELRRRAAAWEDLSRRTKDLEERLKGLDEELAGAEAEILTRAEALSNAQRAIEALQVEAEALREKRRRLYGDRDPDREEAAMKRALLKVQEAERGAQTAALDAAHAVEGAKDRIAVLKGRTESRARELSRREAAFARRLLEEGFSDEASFVPLRALDVRKLARQAEELDSEAADLRGRRQERQEELERQLELDITREEPEALQERFDSEEQRLGALRKRLSELSVTLQNNEERREARRGLEGELSRQERAAGRWARLNTLIGSAKGQSYSVFAQKLTLDLVVENANRHLRKMSGRYLLTPGGEDLSLLVMDAEQAGENRPTSNLSGGESFIVSLALALGLSQMSGSQMDSLFLDEGFGSLDEEALEMALEALSEVRREGRIIGIISHVQALKERIPTQIQVIPRTEGISVLSGPGVRAVS